MIPAVPRPEPTFLSESKSINTSSQICLGNKGTDDPPGTTAN